jgi:hypothetical protein
LDQQKYEGTTGENFIEVWSQGCRVMDIYPYERHGDFQGIRTAKADDASNPVHGGRQ